MNISELAALIESGKFHHATYRNFNTLWEGLWIYYKNDGLRGFSPVGSFPKNSLDLKEAEEMLRATGISVGVYGQG